VPSVVPAILRGPFMRPHGLIDRRPQRLLLRRNCVLILGAGWSAAAGLPLANQLFERATDLSGRDSEVIDAYEEWQHEHPTSSSEQFVAYAYEGGTEKVFRRLPGSPISHWNDPQLELDLTGTVSRYGLQWSDVAAYLQRRLAAPSLPQPLNSGVRYRPELLRRTPSAAQAEFWNWLLDQILVRAIVTTNYDLTTEQTVGIGLNAIAGSPGFHYAGIQNTVHPLSSGFDRSRNPSPTGLIPLAKLHGSLNWSLTDRVEVFPDLRPAFRNGGDAAIIPPLPEKHVPWWLEPVWDKARAELAAAHEWVVVGYSLPPYDYEINWLLADAARDVRRIRIYDPFAESIAERWSKIAPHAYIETNDGLNPNIPASTAAHLTRAETERRRQRALSDPRARQNTHTASRRRTTPKAA
jgi:hypothetical protein